MDFIDEQEGALGGYGEAIPGGREDFAQFLDSVQDGTQLFEVPPGFPGKELGKGRFACAGRAEQNDGPQPVGVNQSAEQFSRREEVLLSDKLAEVSRSHASRQRPHRFSVLSFLFRKQVHAAILATWLARRGRDAQGVLNRGEL